MKRTHPGMTPLGDVISDILKGGILPFDETDARIWKVWKEAVGPTISDHARPTRIRRGVLRVTVSEPVWLQELTFLEETIRKNLNEKLGRAAVKKIEFRTAGK